MSLATSYLFLVIAVALGVTSNSFAKSAEGFTLIFPSIITGITIVMCMYALSIVMKNIQMGITYASFAGLTIIATVVVGLFRFNHVLNFYLSPSTETVGLYVHWSPYSLRYQLLLIPLYFYIHHW